jgi:hypothetical protein
MVRNVLERSDLSLKYENCSMMSSINFKSAMTPQLVLNDEHYKILSRR